jgi:hypothetical protein
VVVVVRPFPDAFGERPGPPVETSAFESGGREDGTLLVCRGRRGSKLVLVQPNSEYEETQGDKKREGESKGPTSAWRFLLTVGWSRCTRLDRRPVLWRGVRCSCRVQCCRTRGEASIRPLHREGCLLSSMSTAHEVTTPGAHGGLCPPRQTPAAPLTRP